MSEALRLPVPKCVRKSDAELKAAMRAALVAPDFSHTRCHSVNPSYTTAYRYDDKSPSGFMSITGIPNELFEELRAEMVAEGVRMHGGHSPLSPTERR
jgi:hypothetical protein